MLRGIRGAISVEANTLSSILEATEELLQALIQKNKLDKTAISSVIFTVTADLNAGFPAAAARKMGWTDVPLLCAQEIAVPGSLPRVIRILMHVNTDASQSQINHVYLKEAKRLRDDL